MTETLQSTVNRIGATMESVEDAVATMKESTSTVENHMTANMQPDIRELRHFIAELNEKANLRLKRVYRAMVGLIVLNAITLLLVVLRWAAS